MTCFTAVRYIAGESVLVEGLAVGNIVGHFNGGGAFTKICFPFTTSNVAVPPMGSVIASSEFCRKVLAEILLPSCPSIERLFTTWAPPAHRGTLDDPVSPIQPRDSSAVVLSIRSFTRFASSNEGAL